MVCNSNFPKSLSKFIPKEWKTYPHPHLQLKITIPRQFEIDESSNGKDVLFRFRDYPLNSVNFVNPKEGIRQRLWSNYQPIMTISFFGIKGRKYEYMHFDARFGMPTQCWVIPLTCKELGIEFRHPENWNKIKNTILKLVKITE